ncbi:MAG TPA: 4-hydroxythreonine-4-phosphate dehydrogenase PdxA [Acidobacteriaceae bacterium]|nr:4-hydroxythreonine-4-phosphate dehydrogenase PdxA [Acidobacteriaceae bacterium]
MPSETRDAAPSAASLRILPDRILIVADDLTGACDSAAAFLTSGYSVRVLLDCHRAGSHLQHLSQEAHSVLALNTESRGLSTEQAAACIRECVALLHTHAPQALLFKKIDSAGRGPIAAEIIAALDASGAAIALVAPSFPATGRTVSGGVLSISDWTGQNSTLPLRELFPPEASPHIAELPSLTTDELLAAILQAMENGVRILLCDAASQDDLARLVSAALQLSQPVLLAGSAGLAQALAAQLPGPAQSKAPSSPKIGTTLLFTGSPHPVTQLQIVHLERASRSLPTPRLIHRVPDSGASAEAIAAAFHAQPISALILTGGDTAFFVLEALGATVIHLGGEVAPGIPWGMIEGGVASGCTVITKSGGFGQRSTLLCAFEFCESSAVSYSMPPAPILSACKAPESSSRLPRIALSIGDPAGVGAEITLKALADPSMLALAHWTVIGDHAALASVDPGYREHADPRIRFVDPHALSSDSIEFGRLSAEYGAAAVEYVRRATLMCLAGEADAMVTAPLNKEAVTLSGRQFSGHTEYIAELCQATESRMLLASDKLATVHVSTHVALEDACKLDRDRIVRTIQLGAEALTLMLGRPPRIGVAGLNPHAGEHNLFGRQDSEVIAPAIAEAQALGFDCTGPHPPDTIFLRGVRGDFDLIVAMYHDQGHIPMKLIDFHRTVNISLGIPIIRISVDHGTAFDIAGQGIANTANMLSAMTMAARMAAGRIALASTTASSGT